MTWTSEQVLALAPDAGSARSGREIARTGRWSGLGRNDAAAWGECRGSAGAPYQVAIDLTAPAFRCTCPSRKLPCKHALGLLLLLTENAAELPDATTPEWVERWLGSRRRRTRTEGAATAGEPKSSTAADTPARQAAREARVAAGLKELRRWLGDLVRHGLAHAQTQPPSYFEAVAARMVDAQAPGLARLLRETGSGVGVGPDWAAETLARLARLHLAAEGYRRIEELPAEVRADLRTVVGWTTPAEDVLAATGVRDRWGVVGRHVEEEDRLRTQRTWLWGETTGRGALILDFAHGREPLDVSLTPGTAVDASLAFYPGAYPLRARVKARHAAPTPLEAAVGFWSVGEALAAYGAALAASPWLERFPLALRAVLPVHRRDGWRLVCPQTRDALPVVPRFEGGWRLLALSGGQPLAVFGEWDGRHLRPLGAVAEGRFHHLATPEAGR